MIKKIVLIGNYRLDKQFSMLIFENLMAEGYSKSNHSVQIIRPHAIIGKISSSRPAVFKWSGYVDKFIFFPLYILLFRVKSALFFDKLNYHICDHSNAFYLHFLPNQKTIITCHDVLAIRAGLGYPDTYCSSSKSGTVLQKIILNALSGARKLAAVSEFTLNQLKAIATQPGLTKNWVCIHNALSEKFSPLPINQIHKVLQKFPILNEKAFILHVGSDLERKNRKLLIELIYELQTDWDGLLVLAGEPLNVEILNLIVKLKLGDKIVQLYRPSDMEVIALYSVCEAMIFPSYSEGFGWPIIEAQACGAPVITSNKAPMMAEVGGKAALYADPDDPIAFAKQFRKLNDSPFRAEVIRLGYENSKRFDFENTVRQYVELINS